MRKSGWPPWHRNHRRAPTGLKLWHSFTSVKNRGRADQLSWKGAPYGLGGNTFSVVAVPAIIAA
jgi:hypothetical protein